MIKAHFKNKSLIIDLSNIWEKYYWKNLTFRLMYWMELINWENDHYIKEWEVSINYNWQENISITVDDIKIWYRWEMIWIGYYIKADLWSKLLIFRDIKDIDISWREESVFKSSDLKTVKSWEYIWYTDEINRKDIRSEVFKNYGKNLLLFIPNLIKAIFSSVTAFIFWGFLTIFVGEFVWIIVSIAWGKNIYFWYMSAIIIYLLIVYINAYFKYSKLWIDIKFNNKFVENINIKKLISWKAKKEINDIEVKIFWINQERGWYEYNCGSSTCTAYINHTVWNTLLFSKYIEKIYIWEDISKFLDFKLDIDKIYQDLFYAQSFTSNMWLFVWLEVRIMSKKYKDITNIFYIDLENNKFKKQISLLKNNNIEEKDNFNNDFFT